METPKTWNATAVRNVLESRVESDLPAQVFAVLKAHEGKQLTKRILPKLPGGEEVWSIRTIAGMTQIVNRDYWSTQGSSRDGISILMAHQVGGVIIDCAYVLKHNPAYFAGREERNASRQRVLSPLGTPAACGRMAEALNAVLAARAALAEANADLARMTDQFSDPPGPFWADRYEWDAYVNPKKEGR